jgi:ADP-ribose pyrophosphatase YjhB (NUDIX family)
MTRTTTDDSTIESLADPETLHEREDVAYDEDHREFEREKFEALAERYDAIDGAIQVGVTTEDGRLLLQGPDGWAPPGGNVKADEDWVEAARRNIEGKTGAAIEIDDAELLERLIFRLDGDEERTITSYAVTFSASLVDEDSEFAESPTIADDLDLPADYDLAYEWFDEVPEDAHENHVDHIELFF